MSLVALWWRRPRRPPGPSSTTAAHASGGITVSGVGTVKGLPDRAKIEVRMQGKAEITDDALVKYQAATGGSPRRLEKLKLENLTGQRTVGHAGSRPAAATCRLMMNGMGNAQNERRRRPRSRASCGSN